MSSEIPKTMKAARVLKFGETKYSLEEVEVPKPKGYAYLIKMGAAGFCHTDSMVANGEFESMGSKPPITGSHEPAGTIVAMGEDAEKAGKHKVGDRVGAEAMFGACGKCPDCKTFGDATYCTDLQGMVGINRDGGFAEYCIIDSRTAAKLPDSLSFAQCAPLMCAGVTIYNSIKKAEACGLKPGGTIGFSGLGALGHLGVQMAKVKGYKVVGIDARKEPIELAGQLKYPPDLLLNATEIKAEDALKKVAELDKEKPFEGLDAAILLADPQESVNYAVALTARHGLVVAVSQPQAGFTFQFVDLIFRDIRVVGSLLGPQKYLQETVDLCAEKGIESTLSTFRLEEMDKVVEAAHSKTKKGKTVVTFD